MSSMTRITRALLGTAAAAAVALTITTPTAGAVTRDYLELPVSQLADVTHFDIGDTTIHVDFTVPTDVPDGNVWTFFHTQFAAGMFDHQFTDQLKMREPLTPGQHFTLELPVSTDDPCAQIDLVLVGPLNPTQQPYGADLTDREVCQPGWTPPTTSTTAAPTIPASSSDVATPTTVAEQPPAADTPAPSLASSDVAAPTPAPAVEQPMPEQTSSMATLPTTGGHDAPLITAGLSLVAFGFALRCLAWAKRRGIS